MTTTLPAVNTLIEVGVLGGESYASRIEEDGPGQLTIAAPLNLLVVDAAGVGSRVTVRWTVQGRGKYGVPGTVVETRHGPVALWVVKLTGPVQLEQNRQFVRGGGGEPIRFEPATGEPVTGLVVDISERSVRGRFAEVETKAGDAASVRITLCEDVVTFSGSVLRVAKATEGSGVEVVLVYEGDEAQAKVIRRYILRQQMLARARAADD